MLTSTPRLSDPQWLTPDQFHSQGGLTIGIGAKNCLYTLRTEYNDQVAVHTGDGIPPAIRNVRRSHHIRNLGKDWREVAERLPEILTDAGYDSPAIYVPGHCAGKLDPNKSPDAKFIPTEEIPFGKYVGNTISKVLESDPDYLYFLAENYAPNEEQMRGRWMALLRETIAPQLEARRVAREAAQSAKKAEAASSAKRLLPLSTFLQSQSRQDGDFCHGIAKELAEGRSLEDLPPRALNIVEDIWAKAQGRRGSKKYDEACDVFRDTFFKPAEPPPSPGNSAARVSELLSQIEAMPLESQGICRE